jgi:molybdate-binding protein
MISKGAARRIRRLRDLARLDLTFVNRERGSGTRLLFDALLAREGIAASDIRGYEHEEFTHMATAATVRAGMADAAFGIEAAARAHGLAFVRLVTERYYLACRRNRPARIAVDTMVAGAQSSAFSRVVSRIGGYELKGAGSRVQLADVFAAR